MSVVDIRTRQKARLLDCLEEKLLVRSPFNVRDDPGDLDDLIADIKAHGILEPVVVRPRPGTGQYEVIAGWRRVEASRTAGLTDIPAIVVDLSDLEAFFSSLAENIQRANLTLKERVQAYEKAQELAPQLTSVRELANALHISHTRILQDRGAWCTAEWLKPLGVRVESTFHPSHPDRQDGSTIPEYHAFLIKQTIDNLLDKGRLQKDEVPTKAAELARAISRRSQAEAKAFLEEVKAAQQVPPAAYLPSPDQSAGWRRRRAGRLPSWCGSRPNAHRSGFDTCGAFFLCQVCNAGFRLVHEANGGHHLEPVKQLDETMVDGDHHLATDQKDEMDSSGGTHPCQGQVV